MKTKHERFQTQWKNIFDQHLRFSTFFEAHTTLRACLLGGRGPEVGDVTRLSI